MTVDTLMQAKANFDITLLDAKAESLNGSDLYLWLIESGLSSEVAIRLYNLVDTVKMVGNQIIHIGKIILIKIIDFVKSHPNLVIGIAVGTAIGVLVSTIPFVGSFLAPIALLLGISIGAIGGHRMDKIKKGKSVDTSTDLVNIGQDIIEIARDFFKLLCDIFNSVFDETVYQGK